MNEKMKKTMKRSLALMLALILAIGTGTWMRDARLKADEEAPEAEVVVEEAAPAEEPAPAPVEEPVIVVQEIELPAEEPASSEEPVPEGEAAPADEEKQDAEAEADAEKQDAEKQDAEAEADAEKQDAEAEAEKTAETKAPFDVRAAYEHYMSLATEEERIAFLESLDPADRAALEEYIALKEAEAAAAEKQDADAEAEEKEEEEDEAEESADAAFGSAKVSGEWAGRDTSATRCLSVEVYVDGELTDTCYTEMNRSVAKFSVALGGCTVESESSTCGAFSGGSGSYKVDMYADTSATVTIKLLAPEVESYTVRFFDFDGEQIGEDQLVKSGEAAVPPEEAPVSEEHEFTGWDVNYDCVTSDLDIYPRVDVEDEDEDEEKEETKHTVSIWFEYISETEEGYGTVVGIYSEIEGFEDEVGYQWQYSTDESSWTNISGATESTYTYTIDEINIGYYFRLTVNGN